MAWGAVFGAWVLWVAGGYFEILASQWDRLFFLAAIAPVVLALILFGQHIRWSSFLQRPGQPFSAVVTACHRRGRVLMLDAPADGYPSGLKVRLAWWAEPVMLPPGESVRCYTRRGGAGRLVVSRTAPGAAFVGTGRRLPVLLPSWKVSPGAVYKPVGQQAGRGYLRWGPLAIFSLGLAAAVVATPFGMVPALTGHRGLGDLRQGDCLTGANLGLGSGDTWPQWVRAVPCTSQHVGEVFFAANAWPQSRAYPGDNAIGDLAYARCLPAFRAYDGIDPSISAFAVYTIAPMPADDWASGDRWLVCVAYESTAQNPEGAPVDYSIKGSQK
jgi:hypothetical protein